VGEAKEGFSAAVVETVLLHAPDFDGASVEVRASSGGKYVSLTCTVNATSKHQLDDLYRTLTAHPLVKVVL
jgi:putative lipoic acid-binding regulatory protein